MGIAEAGAAVASLQDGTYILFAFIVHLDQDVCLYHCQRWIYNEAKAALLPEVFISSVHEAL